MTLGYKRFMVLMINLSSLKGKCIFLHAESFSSNMEPSDEGVFKHSLMIKHYYCFVDFQSTHYFWLFYTFSIGLFLI